LGIIPLKNGVYLKANAKSPTRVNYRNSVPAPANLIEVSIRVNGVSQPLYRRATDGALFTVGVPGQAYTLGVRNMTMGRVEVITTIDGRNTLKDEAGDAKRNEGLIFRAWASGEFSGWRINNDETRQFVFGEPERSVAAQATGDASNVGVIGFAAYREQPSWYGSSYSATAPAPPYLSSAGQSMTAENAGMSSVSSSCTNLSAAPPAVTASAASTDSSMPLAQGLGTGIGERQQDHVGTTTFTRTGAADILVIGYDTYDNLVQMGVIGPPEPSAFPGMGTGYEQYQ
jgi:hypothetical protein